MAPKTPGSNKGADAAGGPSPMTAAATLFASSSASSSAAHALNPTKDTAATNNNVQSQESPDARSVDRAKIIIDHSTNNMVSVELFKEDQDDTGTISSESSSSEDEESSKDGFSDTDGASSSSDEEDEGSFTSPNDDDSDMSSTMSDTNGYLQININGGTLQVLDGTITSPTAVNTVNTKPKSTPARPRSGAIVDLSTPSPSKSSKPVGHTPGSASTPATAASTPSASPPPPPPPPSRNNAVQGGDVGSTSALQKEDQRSPAPGPFQYPPGIPRHKRDRVLRPSPLPSPAKSAGRTLWKRNGSSASASSEDVSSKKASSAATSVLAANVTPGTPKDRKRQTHASITNANTPHRSDSSGENGSSMLMTEEGRRKREEVHLARLVDMAKRQQRFAAAWFAASQGQDNNVVPPPPPSRHRMLPRVGPVPPQCNDKSASQSELDFVTGPIDADSGEAWQDPEGTSTSEKDASLANKKGVVSTHAQPMRQKSLKLEPIQSGAEVDGGDAASFISASSSKTPKISNASPDKRGRTGERGMTYSSSPESRSDLFIDLSNDGSEPSKRGGDSFWTREIRIGPCRLAAMNCFVMAVLAIVVAGAAIVGIVSTPSNDARGPGSTGSVTDIPPNSNSGGSSTSGPREDIASISPGDKPIVIPDIFLRTKAPTPTSAVTTMPTPSELTSEPTSMPSYEASSLPSSSLSPSLGPTTGPTSIYQTTSFTQIDKALSGKESGVQFGYSIALSSDGSVMAVGSRYDAANGPRSGDVRVFVLSAKNKWEQLGKTIKGRNEADQFGFSVALSSDGLTLAASEPGYDGKAGDRSGSVRIFRYDSGEPKAYGTNGSWKKTGELSGEDSTALFGVSISLSGDGSKLAVGAPYHDSDKLDELGEALRKAGRVRVFEYEGEEWKPLGQPIDGKSPSSWWGWSVDLSADGTFFAAGAIRHASGGYVQVYKVESDADSGDYVWTQVGNDMYSKDALPDGEEGRLDDRFGHSVSLSHDADRIIVGCPNSDVNGVTNSGMAVVYQRPFVGNVTAEWTVVGKPLVGRSESAEAGWSVGISDKSNQIIVGAPGDSITKVGAGTATPFRWNSDAMEWEPAQPLYGREKDEGYGFSVAMSADGNVIGVGAPSEDDDRGFAGAYAYRRMQ